MEYTGTIQFIKREQKVSKKLDSNGENKTYTTVSVKMDDNNWYNGFSDMANAMWHKGDEITFNYEVNGNFKNITPAKSVNRVTLDAPAVSRDEFNRLVQRVEELEQNTPFNPDI